KADAMEVLRLYPVQRGKRRKGAANLFHEYDVLHRVRVAEAKQRKELAASLSKGFHWNSLRRALCFNPRHGLKASCGKRTLDLLICFECSRIQVYQDNEPAGTITVVAKSCPVIDRILSTSNEAPAPKSGR